MNSLKKLVFAFACFMVVSFTASAALPEGYAVVEYIQGDKNVYLKTDFTPDPATVGLYDLAPKATKRFYENGATGAPLVAGPATPLPKDNGLVLILR